MKNWKMLLAAVGIVIGGAAMLGGAQAQERFRLPPGSYAETCDRLSVRQNEFGEPVLVGVCATRDGRPNRTSISPMCRGEIVNDDGNLRCVRGGGGGWAGGDRPGRPGGNDWGRPDNGGWGNEVRPGDNGFNRPRGNRSPIQVFEHPKFKGRNIVIDGPIRDLKRAGMNDMISSVRMSRNSGAWEFCERADFRGRCEVLDGSLGNFREIGLHDAVSSIRPVR